MLIQTLCLRWFQWNLEQKLQKAFNLSAEYVGIEPPEVKISRDFDIERLIGQDITALTSYSINKSLIEMNLETFWYKVKYYLQQMRSNPNSLIQ